MMTAALITSAIFGGLKMLGYGINFGFRSDQAQKNIEALERQKAQQLKINDLQFAMDQKDAFKKADQVNRDTTLAEAMLGTNANIALNDLSLQQQAQTLAYNMQSIQSGATEGSSYQAIAASGTRDSSSKNMVQMQSNLAENQLQLQEDIDRRKDVLTLESAVNNLAEGSYGLQTNRNQAKDLRDKYSEGGDVYNLYQQKRQAYVDQMNDQIAKQEQLRQWDWWNDTVNLLTTGVDGAISGFKLGKDIGGYIMDWKSPKLGKTPKVDTNTMNFDNLGTGYNNIYIG